MPAAGVPSAGCGGPAAGGEDRPDRAAGVPQRRGREDAGPSVWLRGPALAEPIGRATREGGGTGPPDLPLLAALLLLLLRPLRGPAAGAGGRPISGWLP